VDGKVKFLAVYSGEILTFRKQDESSAGVWVLKIRHKKAVIFPRVAIDQRARRIPSSSVYFEPLSFRQRIRIAFLAGMNANQGSLLWYMGLCYERNIRHPLVFSNVRRILGSVLGKNQTTNSKTYFQRLNQQFYCSNDD
jgi:hypothetical protein